MSIAVLPLAEFLLHNFIVLCTSKGRAEEKSSARGGSGMEIIKKPSKKETTRCYLSLFCPLKLQRPAYFHHHPAL